MVKYKALKMNTGDRGKFVYTIMRWNGNEWFGSRPVKYYKTKVGVMREIKKRMKR